MPSAEELADPKLYANNVRALMGKVMNQPLLPHSHAQFLALKKLKVRGGGDGWEAVCMGGEGVGTWRRGCMACGAMHG